LVLLARRISLRIVQWLDGARTTSKYPQGTVKKSTILAKDEFEKLGI
jgi:hypothetical protein